MFKASWFSCRPSPLAAGSSHGLPGSHVALGQPRIALAAVAALVGFPCSVVPAPPMEVGPFVEVMPPGFPSQDLVGFSMDAKAADLDGDQDLDLVIAHEFRPNILLLNNGHGGFSNASSDRLPQTHRDSEDVGVGDFDGDADLDIVIVTEDDLVNELYLNVGGGFFVDASDRLPAEGRSNAVLVADVSGDRRPDILIGNNGQNVVLVGDGKGGFLDESAARLPKTDDVTQDLELGDIDGDMDLDLLVGNEDRNRILLNEGGTFEDVSEARLPVLVAPEETREADFGDIDGDGDLDVFFANVRLFVAGSGPTESAPVE